MTENIIYLLIFVAVALIVWNIIPILTVIGLKRSNMKYISDQDTLFSPMYRFTTPERLCNACWSTAILCSGLMIAVLIITGVLNPAVILIVALIIGCFTFQIPIWILHSKIKKRQSLFEARLTDLTIGMANGLRAGSALPQTLEAIARDMGGPMGEELHLILQEYKFGVELPECLERLTKRMPSEDLSLLVTAIKLTIQSGGSLAEVLEKITDTIRFRVDFNDRLKTMTAQGRFEAIAMASAPLAAFAVLMLVNRELMLPLVTTSKGWLAIAVVIVLETIGFLWINKIVTVDV